MKIQPTQNYNTNFQGIHIDKKMYKQLGDKDLTNLYLIKHKIKECGDKFEVLIERGEKTPVRYPDEFKQMIQKFLSSTAGCVITSAGTFYTSTVLKLFEPNPFIYFLSGLFGAEVGNFASRFLPKEKNYEFFLQVGKKISTPLLKEKTLEKPLTPRYKIKDWQDLEGLPDLIKLARQKDEEYFIDSVKNFDIDNIYEPKNILAIIKNNEIKSNYSSENCFNYKLSDKNNDTLLTKFFDIVPTQENENDYKEIIETLKKTKNIDYNQVDSNGIPIIEKIINSENTQALDLVKDFEFNYSQGMDFAYNNIIGNTEFKNKLKELNVTFPDIEDAVSLQSISLLEGLLPELKSPFCKLEKQATNWYYQLPLEDFYNILEILKKNEVDISKIKEIPQKFMLESLNQ